jgi:hypothetical protein
MGERACWVSKKPKWEAPRCDRTDINPAGRTGRNCNSVWTEYLVGRVAAAGRPRFVRQRLSRDKRSWRRGRSAAAADRPRDTRANRSA